MRIGILALQGDVAEHARILRGLDVTSVLVRRIGDMANIDGLVIPGGESTTIAKLMKVSGLDGEIANRAQGGMPVFGTCAGAILMARACTDAEPPLGIMDIEVRRNAYGRQVDSFDAQVDVGGVVVDVAFIRAPVIQQVGENVEVLAHHEGLPVLVREGAHMAATFHPELSRDESIHKMFLAGIRELAAVRLEN